MNQLSAQTQTLIRGILKFIAGVLLMHGGAKLSTQLTAEPFVELVFGVVSAAYAFISSHQKAAQIPVVAVPTGTVSNSGNTEYMVKPANATVTATDPTPRNITTPAIETVRISPEPVKTT